MDFELLNTLENLGGRDFLDISVTLFGRECVIVDFSSFNKYKTHFQRLISGASEIFFWFYCHNQILWLIRGTSPIGGGSSVNGKK